MNRSDRKRELGVNGALRHLLAWTIILLCLRSGFAAGAEDRGLRVDGVKPLSHSSDGNAAMFVGVNEFSDDSLRGLRFAVNDAIAQADIFVTQLKLVPPTNAVLLISGQPTTESEIKKLELLRKAGVHIGRASRTEMFKQFNFISSIPKTKADLLIVSFSTHGFEQDGIAYVMPEDGNRAFLADTGFRLKSAEQVMERTLAGKRLLLVDACREKVGTDDKSIGATMTQEWRNALALAEGQAVLASCDIGQFSYEDPNLNHGVFTHFLLAAMQGQAGANEKGFITLGQVSDFVSRGVKDWVLRHKAGLSPEQAQKPWFKGPNEARDIPLAISETFEQQSEVLAERKKMALSFLKAAFQDDDEVITAEIFSEVKRTLAVLEGNQLNGLLSELEALKENTPRNRKLFAKFWKLESNQYLAGTPRREPVTVPSVSPQIPEKPTQENNTFETLLTAGVTRFTNHLGMILVPVPNTKVWFCIWETRVRDYEAFVQDKQLTWEKPKFEQDLTHPAANVSWNDARVFCEWLTTKGRLAGNISTNIWYRLPTDEEWSLAVGLLNEVGDTPSEKMEKRLNHGVFPWGTVSRFGLVDNQNKANYKWLWDKFSYTAPVGSFAANKLGLYDLGGNVWEWCYDDMGGRGGTNKVLRGAAWKGSESPHPFNIVTESQFRLARSPDSRKDDAGFRCVLDATQAVK